MDDALHTDIIKLGRRYDSICYIDGDFKTTNSILLSNIINDLYDFKKRGTILDLGSGQGLPLMTFTRMGFKAYGIEENKKMTKQSIVLMDKILKEFKWQYNAPEVKCANYFDKNFGESIFKDGQKMSDMDFYYVFAYDAPGDEHLNSVRKLVKSIAKPSSYFLSISWDYGDPSTELQKVSDIIIS